MKYTPDEVAKLLANRPNQPHYIEALIGKCVKAAVLAEREACAQVCDSLVDRVEAEKAKLRIDYARTAGDEEDELRAMRHELTVSTFNAGISKCAAAIRAQGQS